MPTLEEVDTFLLAAAGVIAEAIDRHGEEVREACSLPGWSQYSCRDADNLWNLVILERDGKKEDGHEHRIRIVYHRGEVVWSESLTGTVRQSFLGSAGKIYDIVERMIGTPPPYSGLVEKGWLYRVRRSVDTRDVVREVWHEVGDGSWFCVYHATKIEVGTVCGNILELLSDEDLSNLL